MNLSELLRATARRVPEKTALVHGDESISYQALDREADRVTQGLLALRVESGDRVAIGMHNVPEFAYSYFGILRLGAVAVPLNPTLAAAEVARIIRDSGARVVLATPPFDSVVGSAVPEDVKVISTVNWDQFKLSEGTVDEPRTDDDLAMLPYTSGTTGEPKGVMLTHGNLRANLDQQMQVPGANVHDDDVLLITLPLFHIFGLNVILGLLVMNGATGVLVERFEPVQALRLIQDERVTVLFGAPPMYVAWLNTPGAEQYDLSSVRFAVSGAAPLSIETITQFKGVFGVDIFEGYGLTETAPTLTSTRMIERVRPGSVGLPLPGVDLRLVDEHGDDVEMGDTGEVVVKGPNIFKGYWNRPQETSDAFFGEWFRTGDVGVFDEEGYLYLVDRKRDLVIVSGFNVFPAEVERALLENPKIGEAAVVGVPHAYTGEAVKAFVVLEPGASATDEELIADVRTRVARFKSPETIEIVEALPHLLTGKVLKRALRT